MNKMSYKNSRFFWWKKIFFQLRKKFFHFLFFFSKKQFLKKTSIYQNNAGIFLVKKIAKFRLVPKMVNSKIADFRRLPTKNWGALKTCYEKMQKSAKNYLKIRNFFLLIFTHFTHFNVNPFFAVKFYSFAVKIYSFF